MPDLRPISNALAAIARNELFEVPERIDADIETIRTWLEIQPHLKSRMDDQFIVLFLRSCKYSLERVKEKLDKFYSAANVFPEFYINRDPQYETNLYLMRSGCVLPLPMTNDDDGSRIILLRLGAFDSNKVRIEEFAQFYGMINEILLMEDDQTVIAGQIGVMDFSNVTMALFSQCHPVVMKNMAIWFEETIPLRPKGYHYIHTTTAFNAIFNLFKGFMSAKLRSRLCVHGHNMESLFQHIPRKLLPSEYGGDAGPIQNLIDEWEKKIISQSALLKNEGQYGCDERKRVGRPNALETQFGVDGSFRKLNVD